MRPWLSLLLLGACARTTAPADAPPKALPEARAEGAVTPILPPDASPASAEAPTSGPYAALAAVLSARHAEDVSADVVVARPDAAEGLPWLAAQGDTMLVRARALDLLGALGTPDAVTLLVAASSDPALHEKLRVAAVFGLGRVGDAVAREALLAGVGDPSARVALEAVDVLARWPEALSALRARAADPAILPEVRERLEALPR